MRHPTRPLAPALAALLLALAGPALLLAVDGPRVLLVTAHPDDDALFGGAVYKITHALGGKVDLAVVTNGEGGFKYSTLAEPIYGLDLTDEKVGRERLPAIRKRELMAGGAIVGIRNYFFLDQKDEEYTTSWQEAKKSWDTEGVKARLREILERGDYDFLFTLLPTTTTHGGHQGAALLALETVAALPAGERPIVLSAYGYKKAASDRVSFAGREEFPSHQAPAGRSGLRVRPHPEVRLRRPARLQRRGQLADRRAQVPGHHATADERPGRRAVLLLRTERRGRPGAHPGAVRTPARGPRPRRSGAAGERPAVGRQVLRHLGRGVEARHGPGASRRTASAASGAAADAMAAAKAAGSSAARTSQGQSSPTTSGIPPTAGTTAGRPWAMASRITRPKDSNREVITRAVDSR